MDLFQFGGSEAGGFAFEGFDLVGEFEGFEEPEDVLGAGLVEPGVYIVQSCQVSVYEEGR